MKGKINSQYVIMFSMMIYGAFLILNSINYGQDISFGRIIVITIANSFLIISLITSLYKSSITLILLTMSQVLLVVDEMLKGNTLGYSIENVGYTVVIGTIITLAYMVYIYNKKTSKEDKLSIRIKNVVLYEREPLKLPIWSSFIIWCMFLTVMFNTSNSKFLDIYANDTEFRLYVAALIVLPTFVYLSIYTTSNLIYQFYSLYILVKLYTMYKLCIINSLSWASLVSTLIETTVFIVVMKIYIKYRRINKKCKEKAKKIEKNKKKEKKS